VRSTASEAGGRENPGARSDQGLEAFVTDEVDSRCRNIEDAERLVMVLIEEIEGRMTSSSGRSGGGANSIRICSNEDVRRKPEGNRPLEEPLRPG
jgi:hypothetical protein